jgi:hypothetical protein
MPRERSPLDDVRIASPCPVPWDSMAGDERVRFCPQCRLNVYNLSAMPRQEAEATVRQRETARVCLHFYRRADGSVLTQDCPLGAARKRLRAAQRRLRLLALAALVLLLALFSWLAAWMDRGQNTEGQASRFRDVEPFKTVLDWVAPEPPPPPPPVCEVTGW